MCSGLSVKVVPLYYKQSLVYRQVLLSKSVSHFHKTPFWPKRFFFSHEKTLREHILLHSTTTMKNLEQATLLFHIICTELERSLAKWSTSDSHPDPQGPQRSTSDSHLHPQGPQFYDLNNDWLWQCSSCMKRL